MEHKQGPILLFLTGLGKIMTFIQNVNIKEVGAWVTVIAGSLAAINYGLIIYERIVRIKNKKTIS